MPEYIVELSIGTRKRIVREKLYSSSVDDAEREAINIVKKKEKVVMVKVESVCRADSTEYGF